MNGSPMIIYNDNPKIQDGKIETVDRILQKVDELKSDILNYEKELRETIDESIKEEIKDEIESINETVITIQEQVKNMIISNFDDKDFLDMLEIEKITSQKFITKQKELDNTFLIDYVDKKIKGLCI